MKKTIIGCVVGLVAVGTMSATAQAGPPECNWGELTAYAILELDFDQGPHSADPSGDGHGPGTADEPRAGLPNVIPGGDLVDTCNLIKGLLP